MDLSTRWFLVLATLSVIGWIGGVTAARRTRHQGRAALVAALALLGAWAWMLHHPSVAVRVVPVHVLSWIEGSASVPVFMFIIGIAWARSRCVRQRRLVAWAVVLGCVYFLNGSLWLLQATPRIGFADALDGPYVMQSQDYSCVPAACATTLRLIGVETSEAEMAALTQTRPGTGSTLLRAMEGVRRKLAGSGHTVTLLEPTLDQLAALPTPAMTPLRFESTRRHMVTITRTQRRGVWVADPVDGPTFYPWSEFEPLYDGQVLVIERR